MERYQEIKYKPNQEQIDFFSSRTIYHINLVKKFIEIILTVNLYDKVFQSTLLDSGMEHDKSKFNYPEYIPYVHLTWQKKLKAENKIYEIEEELQNEIHNATLHHVDTNEHHPEFWDSNKWNIDSINKQDRDKPSNYLIDATLMSKLAILQMCADWCAMTVELKEKTPIDWAKKNINIRWEFNIYQEKFIYRILNEIWK